MPCLAPNPPPTAALRAWISAGSRPSSIAISSRTPCGPCDDTQIDRPPAGSPGTATIPPGSIGTGATRWLTMRSRTTTSASSSTPSTGPVPIALATFEPCASCTIGRAVGERGGDCRERRQLVVVDDHGLGRVHRLRLRSRRRPSRRCRRRSAPCPCASGGRFIVGGNMTKPCTVGQVEVGRGVDGDDARHRLRVVGVDRRRCSRARPWSGRTRRAAGRRRRGRRSTASSRRGSPGPPCEGRGCPESSPTSALRSSCAARTGRRLAVTECGRASRAQHRRRDPRGRRARARRSRRARARPQRRDLRLRSRDGPHRARGRDARPRDRGRARRRHRGRGAPVRPVRRVRALPRRPAAAVPRRDGDDARRLHRRRHGRRGRRRPTSCVVPLPGGDRRRRRVAGRAARGRAARVQPGRGRAGHARRRRRRGHDRAADAARSRAISAPRSRSSPRHDAQRRAAEALGLARRRVRATATSCSRRPGPSSGFDDAVRACRRSGTIGLVSTTWEPIPISFLNAQMREVTIVPAFVYGEAHGHAEFDTAATIVGGPSGDRARALITHRFGLDDAPHAFEVATDRAHGAIKVVLAPLRPARSPHDPGPPWPIRPRWTGSRAAEAAHPSRSDEPVRRGPSAGGVLGPSGSGTTPAGGTADVQRVRRRARTAPRTGSRTRSRRPSGTTGGHRDRSERPDELGQAQPGRRRLGAVGPRLPHQARHADHVGERAGRHAWEQAEGTKASFNPLATTQGGFAGETRFNSVGVKNYVTLPGRHRRQRARADQRPLHEHPRRAPAGNSATAVAQAIKDSPWGTGGGVLRVLASQGKSAAPPVAAQHGLALGDRLPQDLRRRAAPRRSGPRPGR